MSGNSESFSIKHWSQDDQPREKLRDKGKATLTDAELVAILIGSGNREESAVELSKRILASADHKLHTLSKMSLSQLMTFKGIGEAKAITIAAALELGKRRSFEPQELNPKIVSSRSVFDIMRPILYDLPHEEFWILYLNNSNKVIHKTQLSKGSMTGTLVDVRLVLKEALQIGAISIVVTHNHPSGTLNPSKADKDITQKLVTAASSVDIQVLDHLIISNQGYFSFADEGMI